MGQAATDEGFELRGEATPLGPLLAGLWRSRSLIRMLARRDFAVRYRRPALGVLWAVGFPLVQAIVLAIVFTQIVRVRTEIPYPVFILSGVVPWAFFASTLTLAVRSITAASEIASKVYFPRAALPLATVGSSLYGFVPALVILVIVAALYGVPLDADLLFLVPATVLMVALTTAFSLVLAAAQVYFRDVAYIVQAAVQAWFYGSAIFYPLDIVSNEWLRDAVIANPVTGVVELFRGAFTGQVDGVAVVFTIAWTVVLLLAAAAAYQRYDRVFPDLW